MVSVAVLTAWCAHCEPTVRLRPVLERGEVGGYSLEGNALGCGPFDQKGEIVDALGARDDFLPSY